MEGNQTYWDKTAVIIIGLSLLAGCNDIDKRQAQQNNGAPTSAFNPFGGGSIVPPATVPPAIEPPAAVPPAFDPEVPSGPIPSPGVQISGEPELAQANERFFFTPNVASVASNLEFAVENLPAWAEFDPISGMISGTPTLNDVGVHAGIVITASDGTRTTELGPLGIEVLAAGDRSVMIAWQPPTTYDDGTPLTDLGGYTIRFGRAEGFYDQVIDVSNPGLTSYVVDELVAGTYFFATSAYDGGGVESDFSPVVSGKIP